MHDPILPRALLLIASFFFFYGNRSSTFYVYKFCNNEWSYYFFYFLYFTHYFIMCPTFSKIEKKYKKMGRIRIHNYQFGREVINTCNCISVFLNILDQISGAYECNFSKIKIILKLTLFIVLCFPMHMVLSCN